MFVRDGNSQLGGKKITYKPIKQLSDAERVAKNTPIVVKTGTLFTTWGSIKNNAAREHWLPSDELSCLKFGTKVLKKNQFFFCKRACICR